MEAQTPDRPQSESTSAETPLANATTPQVPETAASSPPLPAHAEQAAASAALSPDSSTLTSQTPAPPTPDAAPPNEAEEDFEALLDQYDQLGDVDSGDLVQGSIVSISDDTVLIDLGDKTEAIVPAAEFKDDAGNLSHGVGDRVDILVMRRDAETGQMIASRRRAVVQAALAQLEAAFAGDDPLKGKVLRVVKNGLIIDLGLECYMPGSHVDIRRVGDLAPWVGQEVEVIVLELQKGRKRAVVSRRSCLERTQKVEREKFFASTQVGDVVEGQVKNLTEFGVFIDLGGFDGLVPRDELSWERGMSPSDFFSVGDTVKAAVALMNPETGKITLSRKRVLKDPWETAEERFHIGDVIEGTVVNLTPYGAFVRVEEGLTGLIHATDMTWGTKRRRPDEIVKVGDTIKAQVLEINLEKRRLSMGLKQISPDPWAAMESDYPVGKKIKGKVTSVTNFGIFVEITPEIEGLIHQSDLSWERRSVDPKTYAKAGDEIEAVVLKVDRVNHKVTLGHKHLQESPYLKFAKAHKVNSHVKGRVTRVVSFGAFVEVAEGIEGLLHISHLDSNRVDKVEDIVKVGDEIEVKILKMDAQREKINLSRRALLRDIERKEIAQYTKKQTHGGANLGELLQAAGLQVGGNQEPRQKAPEKKAEDKPENSPEPVAEKSPEPAPVAEAASAEESAVSEAPETAVEGNGERAPAVEADGAEEETKANL